MDIYEEILKIFGGYEYELTEGNEYKYIGGKIKSIDRIWNDVYISGYITKQELEKLGELCDYEIWDWNQSIRMEIKEVY